MIKIPTIILVNIKITSGGDIGMSCQVIHLPNPIMKTNIINRPENSNRNSALISRPIHKENHFKDLRSSHISVAVNTATMLHKIIVKAALGRKSDSDPKYLNPSQR
jgi:hypothetical protein